jgi:hypothetical protein
MLISQHYRKNFLFTLNIIFWNSFEEAFALLIREVETIKRDNISKHTNTNDKTSKITHRPHGTGISTVDTVNSLIGKYSKKYFIYNFRFFFLKESNRGVTHTFETINNVADWDNKAVKEWLERIGLMK